MTDPSPVDQPVDPERVGSEESEPTGPRVTDKRRLDPETGEVRPVGDASGAGQPEVAGGGVPDDLADLFAPVGGFDPDVNDLVGGGEVHPDTTLAGDLTRDLQRLQA